MGSGIDRDLPLKKEISDNIKRFMDERRWKQKDLSERTNISKSTLSDYLNCKTLINLGNVEKIAEAFGVSKADIDPSFDTTRNNEGFSSTLYKEECCSLPLYGEIYCGEGEIHFGHALDNLETPKAWTVGGEYFYLEAKGDSMVGARIHEGDLLLIRKQEFVDNGEIAAVVVGDKRMLKRVYKTDNRFTLVSENPKYPPVEYKPNTDENIRIIGKLKRSITIF